MVEELPTWPALHLGQSWLGTRGADGQRRAWVLVAPFGWYKSAELGELTFLRKQLAALKAAYDEQARGAEVALTAEAAETPGHIECMQFHEATPGREGERGQPAGLDALIRWTSACER